MTVCNASVAYTSFCRGLKYLPRPDFWFTTLFFVAGWKHCLMSKKMLQKRSAFAFGSIYLHQTFTECVSNQYTHFYISICQIWLQVMERSFILLRFLSILKHTWRAFMSEVLYVWLNVPNVIAGYGKFSDSIDFLGIFIYYYMFDTLYNVKAEVYRWKVSLCNHLWLRQSSFQEYNLNYLYLVSF